MSCDTYRRQLVLLLYDELSFDDEEQVEQHLESCASCQAERNALHEFGGRLNRAELAVPTQMLADCRRELRLEVSRLTQVQAQPKEQSMGFGSLRSGSSWTSWSFPQFNRAFARGLAAAALLALGFAGGQYFPRSSPNAQESSFQPIASRVRYVEPDRTGGVQITVEETRERVFTGDVQEEPIRKLLLAAARESTDPGVRVETMDLLRNYSESDDVRDALLQAIRHDPVAGVRLKALEGLRSFDQDPKTRLALAQVLLADKNPGVRTQAIDLLTKTHEPSIVGVLQEVLTRENNNYVRLKCQKALHDMNASVETF